MRFVVKKENKVDIEIRQLVEELNITIPIVHVKGSLYLVGISKIHLEQKADYVIAQVGGGYQKFEPWIIKNHKAIERQLIIKMIQSKESLEWIVDALIKGEKIPTMHQTAYDSHTRMNQVAQPSVSRIEVQRVPSSRIDKNGFFIYTDPKLTRRTTMIGSSQSPSRTGLSPTRLDSYSSPLSKGRTIGSPTSRQRTTVSSKGYRMSSSPLRESGKGQKNGYSSPRASKNNKFVASPHTLKLIKQIEAKYEPKR